MAPPPRPDEPPRRTPRLAAGRARALGLPTRGTTNPNRLRRMDNWLATRCADVLRGAPDPLVIDLGFGASPVTAVELVGRLSAVRPDLRVLGLELDPARVAAALPAADPPRLTFARGGFELAGHRPAVVRAANVLRQYDEEAALAAWQTMRAGLAPGGVIVEGTCDELGRRCSWVRLSEDGPVELTFACRLSDLEQPSELAERLPKALIHHNVDGQPIHALLRELDAHWAAAAPLSAFGPRQRWVAACTALSAAWRADTRRTRYGELTVPWHVVAPN
ncbi:class I SAM-dependent methyltransferase [Jatrophihabitans sp.]|uniref:class I SAM-dependent methyltransferase n=1 Tax=Jatrophihabitans sp. TaxID=1932789 RepID=UPI0030C6A7E6|nr:methylase [Jatrophihabitans sp.]